MHTTVTPWSAKDTATAIRLYSEGHTFTEIAKTLRRTRGEIAGKLFRLRREGRVASRLGKAQPPPREGRNPKRPKQQQPAKPRPPQPIRMPKMTKEPSSKHYPPCPPRFILPEPSGPPTIWELKHNQCKFPTGNRGERGPTTFCGAPTEGSSWCPTHHAVVYTRRSA